MLPAYSSLLSRDIKLLFLALAVTVVLAQAAPDGWVKKCYRRIGRCRRTCKEDEKKRGTCGGKKFCCVPKAKYQFQSYPKKQELSSKATGPPGTPDYRILSHYNESVKAL
ncbi:beta-defensin 115-like [Trichechus manatus latirostris]|uniref:Beta-defensin 115-like n=1 Tax=Trichechus manatus latirostris TaxID=127582 RepID=A0A2Y9S1I2_TRIMA|nr:beta-defensin 115-like [Trichechus manatus latirostris]